MCGCEIDGVQSKGSGFKDRQGEGRTNTVQEGAIDLQNGTGVEGNSYPCIKGH
jgi:hypothetical protein